MNLTKRDGNMFKSYSLDAFDFGQNGRAIFQIKKKSYRIGLKFFDRFAPNSQM